MNDREFSARRDHARQPRPRSRTSRRFAGTSAAALTLAAAPLMADPPYVVPPGQNEVISRMLARGESIGPECRLTTIDVLSDRIRGQYRCAGIAAPAGIEIVHPSEARDTPLISSSALVVRAFGMQPLPEGLVDALRPRIIAASASWRWATPSSVPRNPEPAVSPGSDGRRSQRRDIEHTRPWIPIIATLTCVLVVAALGTMRGARSRREKP